MEKNKQEKGITLVILSIIVIALMIIAGVAIYSGIYDVDSTIDKKLNGELKMVQYAVLQQYAKYKTTLQDNCIIYTENYDDKIENFMKQNYSNNTLVLSTKNERDEIYKKYYLITPDDLISIGVQDSEYSYIINYYTGEVMNAEKFTTSMGNFLYTKGLTTSNGTPWYIED